MPSEKDVKDAARKRSSGSREATCSVTGRACKCESGSGCYGGKPILDEPAEEVVRQLKTARLYLQATKDTLDDALGGEERLVRRYPAPEIRMVRLRVSSAMALLDEIVGGL